MSLDICSSMNINYKDTILAGTSPSIKKCHSTRDTDSKNKASVPRIILHDSVNSTYVQSSDSRLWYRNGDSYVPIKNCHVSLDDIFSDLSTDLCAPFPDVLQKIVKYGMF